MSMLNDAWKYETAGASPAVIARQAQDSAAATTKRPVNPKTLMGMGFKEYCRTASPEQVVEALKAFDAKPEEQAVEAGRALAANGRPPLGNTLERLEAAAKAVKEQKSTMAPAAKTKTAPASDGDILERMVDACKPSAKDAAAMRRERMQAAKEAKRANDHAAMAKKKAYDAAVAADKLSDQKRQDLKNRAFAEGVRRSKVRQLGLDTEPSKSAEIGELSPGGGSFAEHNEQEGRVQRKSSLHVTKPGKGRTCDPYANYEGNYGPIAAQLRGEDGMPLTGEAKQAAIAKADHVFYAGVRAQWELS